MDGSIHNGLYLLILRSACAHNSVDHDLDLDLHAVWRESSGIPTPPPCLAADHDESRLLFPNVTESAGDEVQSLSLVECFFHPNHENQSGFQWTGPDPLSVSTRTEDFFLYMSAFFLSEEVHWVEFRLARLHQLSGEMVGEHLFFLPRVETVMGNLSRVRGQILDIISQTAVGAMAANFRLSLWPRTEPLPYSGHSTLSPLATLPTTPCLDPRFFVNNILGNYS